jgi:hypothetical protein
MKSCLIAFFLCGSAFAGQSFIGGSGAGTVVIPPGSGPYGELRLETRLQLQPCVSGASSGNNIVDINGWLGLTCSTTGAWGLKAVVGLSSTQWEVLTPAEADGITDMVIRLQKDYPNRRFIFEAWRTNGTPIVPPRYSGDAGQASVLTTFTAGTRTFFPANRTARIAWVRLSDTKLPVGSSMPKDSFPSSTDGNLGRWEFEGDLRDSSPSGLNIAYDAAHCPTAGVLSTCFVTSPAYSGTVVQAAASQGLAGGTLTLDATQSFKWNGTQPASYMWQWIDGPARPVIVSPGSGVTSVTHLVEGKHTFQYSVGGSDPSTLTVDVGNRDMEGLPIYPTNTPQGTVSLKFRQQDIPNAVDTLVTVRKPDGATFPPVVCVSSPCVLQVDNRQGNHQFQVAYRDAAGKTLTKSDWQEFQVPRVKAPNIYGNDTFRAPAGYLSFAPSSSATSRFLAKRYKHSALSPSSILEPMRYSNPPISLWYTDSRGAYNWQLPLYRSCADARSFNYESMFLHMNADYAMDIPGEFSWTRANQFDWTEVSPTDGNSYWNGVIGLNRNTNAMTDYTNKAFDAAAADVPMTSAVRSLLIGYLDPFDQINLIISTPRTGGTVNWETSDTGVTWAALSLTSDTTNGLTRSGRVTFTPPVGWRRSLYTATANPKALRKFWVRVTVSGATTWPILSQITGDDWNIYDENLIGSVGGTATEFTATSSLAPYVNGRRYKIRPHVTAGSGSLTLNVNGLGSKKIFAPQLKTSGEFSYVNGALPLTLDTYLEYDSSLDSGVGGFKVLHKLRGWCAVDTNGNDRITGVEGWEYDATPGANCSAKFKYQSRQLFGWAANHTVANLADIQGGVRTRAQCILDSSEGVLVDAATGEKRFNGIFLDDLSPDQPSMSNIIYPALGMLPNAVPNVKPIAYTELGNLSARQEMDLMASFIGEMRALLKAKHPTFVLGGNSYVRRMARKWDMNFHEWGMHILTAINWRYTPFVSEYGVYSDPSQPDTPQYNQVDSANGRTNNTGEGFDYYAGGVNGQGLNDYGDPVRSIHVYLDSIAGIGLPYGCTLGVNCTGYYSWDRGNRGPMHALALYYMGATAYTSFAYVQTSIASYFQSDQFYYSEANPEFVTTSALPKAINETTKTINSDFTLLPSGSSLVKLGGQVITVNKVNNGSATTTAVIPDAYPVGTGIYLVKIDRLSANRPPELARVSRWFSYYPAVDIDIGVPDTVNGIVGDTVNACTNCRGQRKLLWRTAGTSGGLAGGLTNEIGRRDFTKAIVLDSSGNNALDTLDVYSNNLVIADGSGTPMNLWVLTADGKTPGGLCGPGITANANGSCPSVKIRAAEGMVLMKAPVN